MMLLQKLIGVTYWFSRSSTELLDARYAAPLKSYGYMVRGKPIVAGDVPVIVSCSRMGCWQSCMTLTGGLAKCIIKVGSDISLAQDIASGAWKKSDLFTFPRKVDDFYSILSKCIS